MFILEIIATIFYFLLMILLVVLVIALAIPLAVLYLVYWILFKSWRPSLKTKRYKTGRRGKDIRAIVHQAISQRHVDDEPEDLDSDTTEAVKHPENEDEQAPIDPDPSPTDEKT